jgi:mono/diheme cytochrome c family protein
MKFKPIPAAVGIVAIAIAAAGVYQWVGNPAARVMAHALQPDDADVRALGQRVYAAHCAACHGAQREGQPDWQSRSPQGLLPAPPHDETGHTWHHPDDLLFRLTKLGVARTLDMPDYQSTMPAFEGLLSDQEIVAVLSWIKSRWPASIRQRHDELNALSLREPAR